MDALDKLVTETLGYPPRPAATKCGPMLAILAIAENHPEEAEVFHQWATVPADEATQPANRIAATVHLRHGQNCAAQAWIRHRAGMTGGIGDACRCTPEKARVLLDAVAERREARA